MALLLPKRGLYKGMNPPTYPQGCWSKRHIQEAEKCPNMVQRVVKSSKISPSGPRKSLANGDLEAERTQNISA